MRASHYALLGLVVVLGFVAPAVFQWGFIAGAAWLTLMFRIKGRV